MSDLQDKAPLRRVVLNRLKRYSQKASEMGQQVRLRVLGFGAHSTAGVKRWSLLEKVHAHRLVQRREAFRQAGGDHSSVARHALNRARRGRQ